MRSRWGRLVRFVETLSVLSTGVFPQLERLRLVRSGVDEVGRSPLLRTARRFLLRRQKIYY